jgi:hypothetical protein
MQIRSPLGGDDADLLAECAAIIDVPKAAPPDSFVLHAPLELLARALLLERLPTERRPTVRERIGCLTEDYAAAGASADGRHPAVDLGIDDVVLTLAAAGHAPILLSLRSRVPVVPPTFGDALVYAEVTRNPDWAFEWARTRTTTGPSSGDLAERLAGPRPPGDVGSDFIYPVMHRTETSGMAADVLDAPLRGMAVDEARHILLRTAAYSMLQDDPDAAPYQWTHCLTLPQAVLAATDVGADADVAVAVAATYVLGFRSTYGRVHLDPAWTPAGDTAAGRVWASPDDGLPSLVDDIVSYGAWHPDAHVAKYTLACLDATADDPGAGRLFLAAAAHLHEWWATREAAA